MPAGLQIDQAAADLADIVVALEMGLQPRNAQRLQAGAGQERIAARAVRVGDRVLEQTVREDHVRTHELAAACDLVLDERAVVDTELELQRRRAAAGLAVTAGRK